MLASLAMYPLPTPLVVHISNATIMIQAALVVLALLTSAALPKEENSNGTLCPIDDSAGMYVLAGIAFVSLAVGAIALASSFTSVRRVGGGYGALGRLLLGIAAAGLVLVPFSALVVAGLCGIN